ncbi:MAG: B12-binding domain-containing radical SAM protein [Candidatus Scalindua sp.]
MNVLFVYSLQDIQTPAKPLQTLEQMQFGISYISSYLKKHGHSTRLLILTRETGNSVIDEYINDFQPGLIGFTAVATEYEFIVKIASYIKSHYPKIYLLIGGPHISLNPEAVISDAFDALCVGEGEWSTLKLVSQLERNIQPSNIANFWIKDGYQIEKNPTQSFSQDIDSLPFPDREMWLNWIANPITNCSLLLGRGCPFKCTYCCNHALRKVSSGKYVRLREHDNILAELEEIVDKFPTIKEVYFEVETFGANIEWSIELCSKLRDFNTKMSRLLSYGVNLRITTNPRLEPLFDALNKSNFHFINIGLESGSEKIRRDILKRNYSNEDVIQVVELARKYGLRISFFNLVGIPGETLDDFRETIKVNRICLPDRNYLSIFFPYPGTDLHSYCKKQGLLKNSIDTTMERSKATLDLPGFNKKLIEKCYIWFEYNVYKGYRPFYKIMAQVIVNKIHCDYHLHRFYRKLTNFVFFKRLKVLLQSF